MGRGEAGIRWSLTVFGDSSEEQEWVLSLLCRERACSGCPGRADYGTLREGMFHHGEPLQRAALEDEPPAPEVWDPLGRPSESRRAGRPLSPSTAVWFSRQHLGVLLFPFLPSAVRGQVLWALHLWANPSQPGCWCHPHCWMPSPGH